MENTEKTRKPRGQRPIYFTMAAIKKDGTLAFETIQAADKDIATHAFKEKTKVAPLSVEGPIYRVMGTGTQVAEQTSVTIKPKDIAYTGNRWEATFKGWKVLASGLKATGEFKKNDEIFYLIPDKPLVEGNPRPKFGTGQPVVTKDKLEDFKAIA